MKHTLAVPVIAFVFAAAAAQPAFAQAQRAIYHFDNMTADDSSPYGNHGTVAGGNFTGGKVNRFHSGLALNGVTDHVSVPDHPSLDITGSITVEAWIKLDAYPAEFAPVAAKWNDIPLGNNNRSYFLTVQGQRLRFDVSHTGVFGGSGCTIASPNFACNQSALVVSSATIPLHHWTHVAGVFDSATKRLQVFVNGNPDTTVNTISSSIFASNEPLLIGAADAGSNARDFLNGTINEVRVWGRALTNDEVAASAEMGYLSATAPGSDQIKEELHSHPLPGGDLIVFTSHFLTSGDVRVSIASSLESTVISGVQVEDVRGGSATCGGGGNLCAFIPSNGGKTASFALIPSGKPKSARLRVTLSTGNTFAINVAL
jgi:hypothetical protein